MQVNGYRMQVVCFRAAAMLFPGRTISSSATYVVSRPNVSCDGPLRPPLHSLSRFQGQSDEACLDFGQMGRDDASLLPPISPNAAAHAVQSPVLAVRMAAGLRVALSLEPI